MDLILGAVLFGACVYTVYQVVFFFKYEARYKIFPMILGRPLNLYCSVH